MLNGQESEGRPCYESQEGTVLWFLGGIGWVFGRQIGLPTGLFHTVASEAQSPLQVEAGAWGPNIAEVIEAPAIDADGAPPRISVKSKFMNLSGVYDKVSGHEAGGRPSYSKKDGTSLYYSLGMGAWIFGRELGSTSGVFLHVASTANFPTEIDVIAWGESIEEVKALAMPASGSQEVPQRLAVKSPYGNLSGTFKLQPGKEVDGRPSYQNKSGSWLFYLEPLSSWVFGPQFGANSFFLQVQNDAMSPVDLPADAWGSNVEMTVASDVKTSGAPKRIAVKSEYDNICGVFDLMPTEDGERPSYKKTDDSSFMYFLDGNGWVLGPELNGDAFFLQAESEAALPTEIEEGAWGEDIEEIKVLGELDETHESKLADCPQKIGFDLDAENLNGGFVRGENHENFPTYFNEEKEVYLWHSEGSGQWLLTDLAPGDTSGHFVAWESDELDPTDPPLEHDGGKFYEVTWDQCLPHVDRFFDKDFPPEDKSFGIDVEGGIEWVSSLELDRLHKPVLWDSIEPNDLMQSNVGDCWLLAALSSMAVYPEQIMKLFTTGDQIQLDGKYVIRLYQVCAGEWKDIVVDDYFPCKPRKWYVQNAEPLCTNPNQNELWVMLIEKAFAKYIGSYAALQGGNAGWAWQAMTGCETCILYAKLPNGTWGEFTNDPDRQRRLGNKTPQIHFTSKGSACMTADQVFQKIKQDEKNGYLMAGAINSQDGEVIRDDGLVGGHEYAITSAADDMLGNGIRLLKLVNPWGNRFEWNGAWSDDSPEWENHLQLKRIMRPTRKRGSRGMSDGVFCMNFEDFFNIYSIIRVCPMSMAVSNEGEDDANEEQHHAPERVKKIFRQWDSSGNGEITLDELTAIFELLNPEFDDKFCAKIFKQIDTNANGKIDYCEFVDWLLGDKPTGDMEVCFW